MGNQVNTLAPTWAHPCSLVQNFVLFFFQDEILFFRGPTAGNCRPEHILLLQVFSYRGFVKE